MDKIQPGLDRDFPICVKQFKSHRFLPHWHAEPEITVIIDGEMTYQIDGHEHHLKKGQAIYINSNCLHSVFDSDGCTYLSLKFDPTVLLGSSESRIAKKYVEPIIGQSSLPAVILGLEDGEEHRCVVDAVSSIAFSMREKPLGYELKVLRYLIDIWSVISPRALKLSASSGKKSTAKQISRMKKAIEYIEEHYRESLSLDDLAELCGLSRSELCRVFKTLMHQSPMEYAIGIRIEKSLPLLAKKEHSMSEIAELCGFSGSSYFAEMFKRYMDCTPTQYIKSLETK